MAGVTNKGRVTSQQTKEERKEESRRGKRGRKGKERKEGQTQVKEKRRGRKEVDR